MRSDWRIPAFSGLVLLAAMAGVGFLLYEEASRTLEEELDRHLLAVARSAAPAVATDLDASGDPSALLAEVRSAARLENAFVLSPEALSLGDARTSIARGARYTLLDHDPDALGLATRGTESLSAYDLEGIPLKAAYVPVKGHGALVLQASPSFVEPLDALARLPWIALALGLAAAFLLAGALWAAHRRLARGIEASMQVERLAVAGRMAAQVAHEIRNPLAILRGAVQLATATSRSGGDPKPYLEDLVEEVDRINGLVDDFVSLSRDVALRLGACTLDEVAERAAGLAELAGARVDRELSGSPIGLQADERRLRQALLGLLLNARESGAPRIGIRTGVEQGRPFLEVFDDGPGMDAETLARAGEPFFTTKQTGTGLGLAAARQIAQAHGGELVLRSRPGAGTRARLYLPGIPNGTAAEPPGAPGRERPPRAAS